MVSLGHQSLPPTGLVRVDEETPSSEGREVQGILKLKHRSTEDLLAANISPRREAVVTRHDCLAEHLRNGTFSRPDLSSL
ncbi:hypothetical protein TNCV_1966391 [Trichonephila clavipes]|nr:hypothetical protein TNCV_1966391 [Trichonephila clavipes]